MAIFSIPGFTDPFSSITHLLGAVVFLFVGFYLIRFSLGNTGRVIAVSIFVFSVVFLLSMSGVFHLLEHTGPARVVLQRLDHAGIFVLIAGTFTPIHGILFKGFWRWGVLFLIWVLAITGIVIKLVYFNELPEWVGLVFYLGLGWVGALSAYLTHRLHGIAIIKPLLYGAVAYTAGALIEFLRWPVIVEGVIGSHELFHIAVLAGIAFHWQFINSLIHLVKRKVG